MPTITKLTLHNQTFTARELEILLGAFAENKRCFDPDFDKLAVRIRLANGKTAEAIWGRLRGKISRIIDGMDGDLSDQEGDNDEEAVEVQAVETQAKDLEAKAGVGDKGAAEENAQHKILASTGMKLSNSDKEIYDAGAVQAVRPRTTRSRV